MASTKHKGSWENSQQLILMQTQDAIKPLHNFQEFSQPKECLDEAM